MSRRYRRYRESEDIVGGLTLVFLIFIYYWSTDKVKFVIAGLIVVIIIWVLFKLKKRRFKDIYNWHSNTDLLKKLRSMHPKEFEDYIADLYSRLGYNTEEVGQSHDGGIDVIATKDKIKHYIQCKKYITSKVGVSEVRDFYGAMAGKLSNGKGIFITTNIFTTEAEKFAEDKPIELIDGNDLIKLVRLAKKENEVIVSKELNKCPNCGSMLVERHGKFGNFLGCSNYPKCKYTQNV